MKKLALFLVLFLLTSVFSVSVAQLSPQIINVHGRQSISLNGLWRTIVDPYESGYWGYHGAPHGDVAMERLSFLTRLTEKVRLLDPVRLVGAAMEKHEVKPGVMTVEDPLTQLMDVLSFNQYVGWYDGLPEKCDHVNWTFDVQKPVIISEFGGGALYGKRGDKTERFTEDFQEDLYVKSVEMMKRIPGLAGVTPWILKDFRSPRRLLPGVQDDFNRKGLVSDKGEKKLAFFVMQKWYSEIKKNAESAESNKAQKRK